VDVTGLLEDDYKIVEKLFKRFEKAAGLSGGSRYLRRKAQLLHHVIDVGEYGLAPEDIAGTLAQDAIATPARNAPICSPWPPG